MSTLNLHDSGADNFLATKWWWILASINEISPGGYAVDLILKAWNTTELDISADLKAPFMRNIKLPFMKNYQVNCDEEILKVIEKLNLDLLERHNVISVVVYIQNELYIRLSCFVYNEMKDYVSLKDAILDLQK